MPKIISHAWVSQNGACYAEAHEFRETFPKGFELPRTQEEFDEIASKYGRRFDLFWLAVRTLTKTRYRTLTEFAFSPRSNRLEEWSLWFKLYTEQERSLFVKLRRKFGKPLRNKYDGLLIELPDAPT